MKKLLINTVYSYPVFSKKSQAAGTHFLFIKRRLIGLLMGSNDGKGMNRAALQQRLRRLIPGFSVRKLGFRRFADFLASLEAADGEPQAKDGGLESSSPGDSAEVS